MLVLPASNRGWHTPFILAEAIQCCWPVSESRCAVPGKKLVLERMTSKGLVDLLAQLAEQAKTKQGAGLRACLATQVGALNIYQRIELRFCSLASR